MDASDETLSAMALAAPPRGMRLVTADATDFVAVDDPNRLRLVVVVVVVCN